MQTYLDSIFALHQFFMIFETYLKIHRHQLLIILSFLFPALPVCAKECFLLQDPNHSFSVHLGRTKNHLKWMTLKISVKTPSQLKMASPVTPWTQRGGTLMTPSWQRMSGSRLSEGLLFCFPRNSTQISLQLFEHHKLSMADYTFCFTILLLQEILDVHESEGQSVIPVRTIGIIHCWLLQIF